MCLRAYTVTKPHLGVFPALPGNFVNIRSLRSKVALECSGERGSGIGGRAGRSGRPAVGLSRFPGPPGAKG
ncbi:DENN domain-containing protein 4B [Frankliniella fusca]|uniref:DENN domain-containing protein 4B n=1 Tax=Frankliniella fusca TaxID=407009 RepID=A0AAE1LDL3_9NEOP|nr:DENN domain-containing protein 4B [Frankliniella fusca]